MRNKNGPFQGQPNLSYHPALTVMTINIDDISRPKEELLSELCTKWKCDVLCIQETHRNINDIRPKIQGMNLVIEVPHKKYGRAIFSKQDLIIHSVESSNANNVEILVVTLSNCRITSVYKPPNEPFNYKHQMSCTNKIRDIIVGDFNSHNTNWGYNETNEDGIKVEQWAEANDLMFIHDPKLPNTFNS